MTLALLFSVAHGRIIRMSFVYVPGTSLNSLHQLSPLFPSKILQDTDHTISVFILYEETDRLADAQ